MCFGGVGGQPNYLRSNRFLVGSCRLVGEILLTRNNLFLFRESILKSYGDAHCVATGAGYNYVGSRLLLVWKVTKKRDSLSEK